jgi:hypothetical protein
MENLIFKNFTEVVGILRTEMMLETEAIMKLIPNKKIIITDGSLSIIDTEGGVKEVIELMLRENAPYWTIDVVTENDTTHLADLETDDMVAVYEFVYGEYENQLN